MDAIVIGAGFAGATAARILAKTGKKVIIFEKQNHIGGNAYDYTDEHDVLVHQYGPHIFHTNYKEVFDFLSEFTIWRKYEHKVLADVKGMQIPVPFNFNSLKMVFLDEFEELKKMLIAEFGYGKKVNILEIKNSEIIEVQKIADYVYENIFLNYTKKQWGFKPEEIDKNVTARVPIFFSEDNRYFQDTYQYMPKDGYAKLFENMLDHKNIKLILNTDGLSVTCFKDEKIYFENKQFSGIVVYTGSIDKIFNYKYGYLPYRTVKFVFENYSKEYFQNCGTVNYTVDKPFTRITEFKHLTGQISKTTTILKEYPMQYDHKQNKVPCYPIVSFENIELYKKYMNLAKSYKGLVLLGRLAEYKYFDMDIVVKRVMETLGGLQ